MKGAVWQIEDKENFWRRKGTNKEKVTVLTGPFLIER